ncbi:hypothetical protein V8E53_015127 [Lactarius tabidus]
MDYHACGELNPTRIATIYSLFFHWAPLVLTTTTIRGFLYCTGNMLTFRLTAPGSLITFVALLSLPLYIPSSHAQIEPSCAVAPCTSAAVPECSIGCDTGDPGLATSAVSPSPTDFGTTSNTLTFPSTPLPETTSDSLNPTTTSTTLTTPTTSTVITPTISTTPTTSPTSTKPTSSTPTTSTSSTGTLKTAEPTQTISSSNNNAAASLSTRARVAAALIAGGIGALVAIAL